MELKLYAYYEIATGYVYKTIDIKDNRVVYVVFDKNGKKIPALSLGGNSCSKKDFIKAIVRRVKPKAKPKKEKPKEKPKEQINYMEYRHPYAKY